MINDSHVISFGWAKAEHIEAMKDLTIKVNTILKDLFLQADMLLVDYKLEFGLTNGEITLGDEFSLMAVVSGISLLAIKWIKTVSGRIWVML